LDSKRQGLDKKEQKTLTHTAGLALSITTTLFLISLTIVVRDASKVAHTPHTLQRIASSKMHTKENPHLPGQIISS
jgi:hypothetical protein